MITLSQNSWIQYIPGTFLPTKAQQKELMEARPTHPRLEISMYGTTRTMPRDQRVYGHLYSFSKITLHPKEDEEIPALVKRCMDYANDQHPATEPYNGALVNWYMNGNDSISAHSDAEDALVPDMPIYSFSFGATRDFVIRTKKGFAPRTERFTLTHGTIVVMGGEMQKEYTHEVPKTKHQVGCRINVTVRAFRV